MEASCEGHLVRLVRRVCLVMPDFRRVDRVEYPAGLLTLSIFLAECAGCVAQKSKEIWLKEHFRWICKLWRKCEGKVKTKKSPSQSTISRFEQGIDVETFSRLLAEHECADFDSEWKSYRKVCKAESLEKKKRRKRSGVQSKAGRARKMGVKREKPFPQYCFDGKSRKGCVSDETGRSMIDVTLYCPETGQILATRTLADKEGESRAVIDILENEARNLPRGIVTADAGILSPSTATAIINAGHGYFLQLKGNAGEAFREVLQMPWDKVTVIDKDFCEGHGRREIRRLKRLTEEHVEFDELSKYQHCDAVWQRENWVHQKKEGKYTSCTRYFVGDGLAASLPDSLIQRYARDHWKQESYHWVKDAVLGEDASFQKRPNGSRFLSLIRSQIFRIGKAVFGSTKSFKDHFLAAPERTTKKL